MTSFSIKVPPSFDLAASVCSYGWCLLAPNRWIKPQASGNQQTLTGSFERPLSLRGGDTVVIRIRKATESDIEITVQQSVRQDDQESLRQQVSRMLRLSAGDEQVTKEFQARHDEARQRNFGRLLRSPTVWEDVVKCILLCNCGWGRTVAMNRALCEKVGREGAFPTAPQIAGWQPEKLQSECGLGYRAKHIVSLALKVTSRECDLNLLEDPSLSDEELLKKLQKLPGVGPFSASNMLQLLGRYSQIACDSETVRHLKSRHGKTGCSAANVRATTERVYEQFAPYQFLAYWFELWQDYEKLLGPIAELDPQYYGSFTGSNMKKNGISKRRESPPPAAPKRKRK